MRFRHVALLAGTLLAGCDGRGARATGTDYQGAPLVVVNGRMTAERDLKVLAELRLALAWYTAAQPSATAPDAVETQSVAFEPVFPVGFSFGLYQLPRVEAAGLAAGVLVAYDDRNRNGALDTYAPGDEPIDAVLGTSLGSVAAGPDPQALLIAYFEREPPPPFARGFNLTHPSGELLSFEQPVPLHLTREPLLDLFACRAFDDAARQRCRDRLAPGSDGGAPDAGVTARVAGSVGVANGRPYAALSVSAGGAGQSDASVDLNGVALAFDAPSGQFRLPPNAPAQAVVLGGGNVLNVATGAAGALSVPFYMPGSFAVTAPAFNATLSGGAPFDVAWTDSRDAGSYRVSVFSSSPFARVYEQANLTSSPFTVPGVAYQGPATLVVEAAGDDGIGPNGSFVFPYVNQSLPVTLQ